MILTELLESLRIELQDQDESLYDDKELERAIDKSISLMSRLVPKKSITEATISGDVTSETLVIASSTGTLAHSPIKPKSLTITGKTLDTHYSVNYLTGVVTEIGSGLTDGNYTASYSIDASMIKISSILPDCIKIERIEYPVGNSPPSIVTFDVFGDYVYIRGNSNPLKEDEHIRFVYLSRWTPPTPSAAGDYPTHLDDAVIIGSSGQALIFKAEKYVKSATTAIATASTALTTLHGLSLSLTNPAEPSVPTLGTISLATISVTAPTEVTLESVPTKPSFSDSVHDDITSIFTNIYNPSTPAGTLVTALSDANTASTYINAATRGEQVAANYIAMGNAKANISQVALNVAIGRMKTYENALQKYASDVTAFGSEVNAYANQMSAVVNKFRADVDSALLTVQAGQANASIASAQASLNNALNGKYAAQVDSYRIDVSKDQNKIAAYSGQVQAYASEATQAVALATNYLDIAGRYLASGQAKINEMLTMLGIKAELQMNKASSEQR